MKSLHVRHRCICCTSSVCFLAALLWLAKSFYVQNASACDTRLCLCAVQCALMENAFRWGVHTDLISSSLRPTVNVSELKYHI